MLDEERFFAPFFVGRVALFLVEFLELAVGETQSLITPESSPGPVRARMAFTRCSLARRRVGGFDAEHRHPWRRFLSLWHARLDRSRR